MASFIPIDETPPDPRWVFSTAVERVDGVVCWMGNIAAVSSPLPREVESKSERNRPRLGAEVRFRPRGGVPREWDRLPRQCGRSPRRCDRSPRRCDRSPRRCDRSPCGCNRGHTGANRGFVGPASGVCGSCEAGCTVRQVGAAGGGNEAAGAADRGQTRGQRRRQRRVDRVFVLGIKDFIVVLPGSIAQGRPVAPSVEAGPRVLPQGCDPADEESDHTDEGSDCTRKGGDCTDEGSDCTREGRTRSTARADLRDGGERSAGTRGAVGRTQAPGRRGCVGAVAGGSDRGCAFAAARLRDGGRRGERAFGPGAASGRPEDRNRGVGGSGVGDRIPPRQRPGAWERGSERAGRCGEGCRGAGSRMDGDAMPIVRGR